MDWQINGRKDLSEAEILSYSTCGNGRSFTVYLPGRRNALPVMRPALTTGLKEAGCLTVAAPFFNALAGLAQGITRKNPMKRIFVQ